MLSKEESYLQNFWKPQVGHRIIYNNKVTAITSIDKKFPEQITLRGVDEIAWIQDYSWKPQKEDLEKVLTDLGCFVYSNMIKVGKKTWKGLPAKIEEYAQLIREVRMIIHTETGTDPLVTYFSTSKVKESSK